MATSGTVGATTFDVSQIIEHAFRRAGITTSKISGEQQLAAKENLYLLLTDLANDGVNLWCIAKQLYAYVAGQPTYPLTIGVYEVLRAYNRTMQYPQGTTTSSATTVGINVTDGSNPATFSVGVTVSSTATQNLAIQYNNGSGWVTALTIPAFTGTVGNVYWFDLPVFINASAWQVLETVAGTIGISAAIFGNTPSDIQMGKLTRDDYWGMPNKTSPGRALQYWFDKQITPQMWVWQVPTDPTQLMVVEAHLQIQDVGSLTNTLAVPNRWLQYVIWALGHLIATERTDQEDMPANIEQVIMRCEKQAMLALNRARTGESDGAPLRLTPNLRSYTA